VVLRSARLFFRFFIAAFFVCLLASCASHDLPDARSAFYRGNYELAKTEIGTEAVDGKDSILLLMERGTIYQADGEYEKSSMDYIQAYDMLDALETYSVSEGAGSWVANDTVYSFEGAPFEQTMLHSMTALNHLAVNNWEHGAVEARRILHSLHPDNRGEDYPDDAFSRYLAAFILEMTGDRPNAEAQYFLADELLPNFHIDKRGRIGVDSEELSEPENNKGRELVCFFLLGRSPSMRDVRANYSNYYPPRIQLYAGETHLGDARILTSVHNMAISTWNIEGPARIAKTAARIAAKEVLARKLEKQDEALGALARIILIGLLERPDFRRWETLPLWLAVARVPYPEDLVSFDIRLNGQGIPMGTGITVDQPLVQRGNVVFSFVRDLPDFNKRKMNKEIDKLN
jgi:tetratricopeptide (TPR) repeat protein